MDGPGISLYQEPIHINNSAEDRLEEQEQLEDETRRRVELKQKLDIGFDDLNNDDDASSVNSSANFTADQSHHFKDVDHHTHKLPPMYEGEHLKDFQQVCETPKHHHMYDPQNYYPLGAGDGQNYCPSEINGHMNGLNMQIVDNRHEHQKSMDFETLQVMYEMRVKEVTNLISAKKEMQEHYDTEVASLRSRLSAALNDKDKSESSLQQVHQLLATSKAKIYELEQQITSLTNNMATCKQEKIQVEMELQSCNITLQQTQQKLHANQIAQNHKTDSLFKEQQIRHAEELNRLQDDLETTKTRLKEKDNEVKILENRCKEKERENEKLLSEKAATINKLAHELDTAQNQITSRETNKMKEIMATYQRQIKELGTKLKETANELVVIRNKYANLQKDYEDWRSKLQQILQECQPDIYIGEPSSPSKLATLKDILTRYEQQAQKCTTLQDELLKRDKKLDLCRKQEVELRSKLDEQKSVEMQLNTKLTVLQNKIDHLISSDDGDLLESYKKQNTQLQQQIEELRAEHKALDLKYTELEMEHEKCKNEREIRTTKTQEINADLLKEFSRQSAQHKEIREENDKLKHLYLNVCVERDAKVNKMKELENKLLASQREKEKLSSKESEYLMTLERERQQVTKLTTDLKSEREEAERANTRISELQKEFSDKQKEFNDKLNKYIEEERTAVRTELQMCTQCEKYMKSIRNLKEQISICHLQIAKQASNGELMEELKKKAGFFQDYIMEKYNRVQKLTSVGTNTEAETSEEGTTLPTAEVRLVNGHDRTEDTISARTELMEKEKDIRDQIAEKFTIEIKTVEMKCSKKLKELENEHICNVNKLKQLIERKVDEVETLKQFILSERSKITEILEAKESEISMLIKENNSLQTEFQDFRDKAAELKSSFEKTQSVIFKYKNDFDNKCLDLENERENFARTKNDLIQKVKAAESRSTQLETQHQLLKEKYKNVKKTALTYKEYAAKKDEHVESELDRIKTHYKDIITELQNKMQQLVGKRQQAEVTDRINKIQTNFNAMMSNTNRQL